MSALLPTDPSESNELAAHATAPRTKAAYGSVWRRFTAFCSEHGVCPLPAAPSTVADYLVSLHHAGCKHSTLSLHCSAISTAHRAAGYDEPPTRSLLVRKTLQGAAKQSSGTLKAPALPVDTLRAMVAALPRGTLLGWRDRAVLTVGFFGALRGDDLDGLRRCSVEWLPWGVVLNVRGKTERGAVLRRVALERRRDQLCPVWALERWLDVAPESDSLFSLPSSGRVEVKRALHRAARRLGLACPWSAHSLRAGLVTAAHAAGCSESDIALTTGHRGVATLRGYIREADLRTRCLTTRI